MQLHALSGKGQLVLNLTHFELLTDVLRVILREANNDHDALSIRMVYLVAELVGTYLGPGGPVGDSYLRSVKVGLRTHEAWQNVDFFNTVLDECVARDKQHWMHLHGPLQEILCFEVHNEEIIALLLSFRLKAIAHAILQLRAPLHLIEGVLAHCRRAHGATFSLDDLYEPLQTPFMLWLLDVAARAWHLPSLAASANPNPNPSSSSSSSPYDNDANDDDSAAAMLDNLRRRASLSSIPTSAGITAKSSVNNVLRWATEMTVRATHWASLGFSIHHEVFRFVVDRIVANPQTMDLLTQLVLPTTTPSVGRSSSCLCSRPYKPWRLLGGYGDELQNVRRYVPAFLCEGCFRCVVHHQRLDSLRLQQSVGVACIPASEIRTPGSIAVFIVPGQLKFSSLGRGPPTMKEQENEGPVMGRGASSMRRLSSSLNGSSSGSGSGNGSSRSGSNASPPMMAAVAKKMPSTNSKSSTFDVRRQPSSPSQRPPPRVKRARKPLTSPPKPQR